ncbi:hypothetical protein G6L37_00520 [Agrobacterium rubi]|nr:hypothetical protein [Agrobacterium rubi]NTF23873.1 hypothetical protein [Agrobacterium rubi]
MRYVVVELKEEAALIAEVTEAVSEEDLSIIVAGKRSGLTLALSIAIAKHAPVAFVQPTKTLDEDRIREDELNFQDFVSMTAFAVTPVLLQAVPDIAVAVKDEEWVGKLLDFATSDDYAQRNKFAYRR